MIIVQLLSELWNMFLSQLRNTGWSIGIPNMDKFTIPIKPGGIIHMFTSFHKQLTLSICNGWDYELMDGLTAGMVHWSAVLLLPVQQKTIWMNSNTNESLKSLAFHHTHRIHGAGIHTNIKGLYWWDPCIYSSTMDPMGYGFVWK